LALEQESCDVRLIPKRKMERNSEWATEEIIHMRYLFPE
jgi:hypothetical protein